MNSLINRANRQVNHIKNDLSSLKDAVEARNNSSTPLMSTIGQLSASLSGLQSTIRDLETMTRNETDQSKREEYKEKLKLLQTDLSSYRSKFDQLKNQISEQEKLRNREELFGARKGEDEQTNNVTERLIAQREEEVLSNTSSRLDEYISIGMATISDLKSQKSALKSTQKRLFDATSSLGISQSLMRIIRQRSDQERAIFYIGIICTFAVIFILWKYF